MSERGESSAAQCGLPSSAITNSTPHRIFRCCFCWCCASPSFIYSAFFFLRVCLHGLSVSVMGICFSCAFLPSHKRAVTGHWAHIAVISVFVPETILFVWINMVWCVDERAFCVHIAQERRGTVRTSTLHFTRYRNFYRLKKTYPTLG